MFSCTLQFPMWYFNRREGAYSYREALYFIFEMEVNKEINAPSHHLPPLNALLSLCSPFPSFLWLGGTSFQPTAIYILTRVVNEPRPQPAVWSSMAAALSCVHSVSQGCPASLKSLQGGEVSMGWGRGTWKDRWGQQCGGCQHRGNVLLLWCI